MQASIRKHWTGKDVLLYGHSVKGRAHVRKGMPNQDAYFIGVDDAFAAVADGHGGGAHPYSAIGASLAVKAVRDAFLEYRAHFGHFDKWEMIKFLENDFAYAVDMAWKASVAAHYRTLENPVVGEVSVYTLYGTTLLMAFEHGGAYYFLQIGDGSIFIIDGDTAVFPIMPDKRLHHHFTTSLAESNAWLSMRVARYEPTDALAFIGLFSDGVEGAYPGGGEEVYDFAYELFEQMKSQPTQTALERALAKAMQYSTDDTTGVVYVNENGWPKSEVKQLSKVTVEDDKTWLPIALQEMDVHLRLEWLRNLCNQSVDTHWFSTDLSLKALALDALGNVVRLDARPDPVGTFSAEHFYSAVQVVLNAQPKALLSGNALSRSIPAVKAALDCRLNQMKLCYRCGHYNLESTTTCAICEEKLQGRFFIERLGKRFQLFYNSTIYLHHVMPLVGRFDPVIGRVVQHPKHPQFWAIENCSTVTWYVGDDLTGREVHSGEKVVIREGETINICGCPIKITYRE